mmetsp:Transcript_36867/g.86125  ORF Transcript_36867/g.86125 Transcript_36867/m.86125 type:complete len:255 (-) Transcript_36867:392-1156(-)
MLLTPRHLEQLAVGKREGLVHRRDELAHVHRVPPALALLVATQHVARQVLDAILGRLHASVTIKDAEDGAELPNTRGLDEPILLRVLLALPRLRVRAYRVRDQILGLHTRARRLRGRCGCHSRLRLQGCAVALRLRRRLRLCLQPQPLFFHRLRRLLLRLQLCRCTLLRLLCRGRSGHIVRSATSALLYGEGGDVPVDRHVVGDGAVVRKVRLVPTVVPEGLVGPVPPDAVWRHIPVEGLVVGVVGHVCSRRPQ